MARLIKKYLALQIRYKLISLGVDRPSRIHIYIYIFMFEKEEYTLEGILLIFMFEKEEYTLEGILLKLQEVKALYHASQLHLIPLKNMVSLMPPGFRSVASLRRLTVDSDPPILSYVQLEPGSPILMNPAKVQKDLEVYEKRGIAFR